MQAYFEDLYAYHRWANEVMLSTMTEEPPAAVALFSHLLNAHFVWLDRIENQPPVYDVWQEHPVADLADLSEQAYQRTLRLLRSEKHSTDLGNIVRYQNTGGAGFWNTVQEILTHVSNHTTHHRAQVARELRQHGIAPPATDYIYYQRTPLTE